MASEDKPRVWWVLIALLLPLFLIGSFFAASKRGAPQPPPMGEFQAKRAEKWRSQEFFSITNAEDLKDAVSGFRYEYNEALSAEEARSLTNAVVDLVTAFQTGTFDDYARFRMPTTNIHFPAGISNAMRKEYNIPAATIHDNPIEAFRQYWHATKRDTRFTNFWLAVCVTNSEVRVEKSDCPTNDLVYSLTMASPTLTVDSLRDAPRFAKAVREGSDPIINYLKSRLSPATVDLLLKYRTGPALEAREAVIKDFNALIQDGSLRDRIEFKNVQLSPETEALVKKNPTGKDLVRVNRLILSEALPEGVLKGNAWAENIGMGWRDPSVLLEPSREQVLKAVGHVKIATLRVFPKPRGSYPIFPVYVRWFWSPEDRTWLPEQLVCMYSRPLEFQLFF